MLGKVLQHYQLAMWTAYGDLLHGQPNLLSPNNYYRSARVHRSIPMLGEDARPSASWIPFLQLRKPSNLFPNSMDSVQNPKVTPIALGPKTTPIALDRNPYQFHSCTNNPYPGGCARNH
eukprot:Gb_21406 [translate_table: standard]